MANLLESHWCLVKRIPRYLSGTIMHDLLLSLASALQQISLRAYNDLDWASDPDDKRSNSGSCVYFGSNLIVYSLKKEPLVARSSTEAENQALGHTTYEL